MDELARSLLAILMQEACQFCDATQHDLVLCNVILVQCSTTD